MEGEGESVEVHVLSGTVSYPYTLDWREKGFVSSVSSRIIHKCSQLFSLYT